MTCSSGRGRGDIDLAVEGDPRALAAALGAEPLAEHSRFGTLKVGVAWGGARPRRDAPRALRPAGGAADGRPRRPDPHRPGAPRLHRQRDGDPAGRARTSCSTPTTGRSTCEAGVLRVIHDASFVDDPTRAIRAARYAARFGFGIEEGTRELLLATDLGTVTPERRAEELRRLARRSGRDPRDRTAGGMGSGRAARPAASRSPSPATSTGCSAAPPWAGEADRAEAILAAALGPEAASDAGARAPRARRVRPRASRSPAAATRSSSSSPAPPAPSGSTTGSAGATVTPRDHRLRPDRRRPRRPRRSARRSRPPSPPSSTAKPRPAPTSSASPSDPPRSTGRKPLIWRTFRPIDM